MLRARVIIVTAFALSGAVFAAEPKLTEPRFLLEWGQKGDKPGEFYSPIGLAFNAQDELFVTDLNNSRVQKFSTAGKHLGGFDLPRDDPKRKSCMVGGIAVDGEGLVYLSMMIKHKVMVFTGDGKLVREWGRLGKGDGEFNQPGGIVIEGDGTVFVADQCNHRVQKFSTSGSFLGKWGEHGSRPGQFGGPESAGSRFAGPHFLTMDSKRRFYTTEGVLGRIQQLSADGTPLAAWGSKGKLPGEFGEYKFGNSKHTFGPIGVKCDRYDRVWVSSLNDRVQAFTPEGKYLFGIATSGDQPGQLIRPHGMAFDRDGHLYVADAHNQRIQKFAVPSP